MKPVIHLLNILLPVLYLGTFSVYFNDFIRGKKKFVNAKRLFIFITLFTHLIYLFIRTSEFEYPPITNVFEIFTVLAFSITFFYFLLELVTDIRGTGPFIIIISFVFQLISSLYITDQYELKEVLRNNLLGIHVINALLGYIGFAIAAVFGFLYLILYKNLKHRRFGIVFNRLPKLEVLERLSFYSAVVGFIFLTIAIITGIIWLPQAFPDYSFLDPKLIVTAVVWLLYGGGIISKLFSRRKEKKIILLSIAGFLIAIFSTVMTNFPAHSFHSFY